MSGTTHAYDLMIFDWDGTLSDSCSQIVAAVQSAAAVLGLPKVNAARIRAGIGMSFSAQVAHLYGNHVSSEKFRAAFEQSYFGGAQCHEPPLFDGVRSLLQWGRTQQKAQAIATGKSRYGLDQSLAHHGIASYFDHTICAGEARSKPDPDMLVQLLRHFDCPPHCAVMIGDTLNDAHAAQSAGIDFIGLTTGGNDLKAALSTAPHVALLPTVMALLAWFQQSTA